jgi:hypothetical protein
MARKRRGASPTLKVAITEEQWEKAVASQSGGCLIADAIKRQYPKLSNVEVDMATIRATDKDAGERYTYLTSPQAQHLLLSFDQGWPNPTEELTIRAAVHVRPIYTSPVQVEKRKAEREARIVELEHKQERGEELTKHEKAGLTKMKRRKPPSPRPSTQGAAELVELPGQRAVVVGGKSPVQGSAHPNLLRGRNRHFGAKMADPGKAFKEAVEAAVAEREAK